MGWGGRGALLLAPIFSAVEALAHFAIRLTLARCQHVAANLVSLANLVVEVGTRCLELRDGFGTGCDMRFQPFQRVDLAEHGHVFVCPVCGGVGVGLALRLPDQRVKGEVPFLALRNRQLDRLWTVDVRHMADTDAANLAIRAERHFRVTKDADRFSAKLLLEVFWGDSPCQDHRPAHCFAGLERLAVVALIIENELCFAAILDGPNVGYRDNARPCDQVIGIELGPTGGSRASVSRLIVASTSQ